MKNKKLLEILNISNILIYFQMNPISFENIPFLFSQEKSNCQDQHFTKNKRKIRKIIIL